MKSNSRVLLSTLLCISLATAGSGAQAELFQRSDIRARLVAQGIDATEAEARVASLTDEETALLSSRFDELPAGGDRGLFGLLFVAGVVYVVIKLLPLILIGGGTVAAIKASNRGG